MTNIFVLGSNSFAGRQTCSYFQHQGLDVTGISRSAMPHKVFFDFEYSQNLNHDIERGDFRFFQMDINRDLGALQSLLDAEKPAFIIDMAGQGMVAESWQNPSQWYQTNIMAKIALHQWLKDCDWLEKYIRVSTPEVYGSTPDSIPECQPYNPSTPYAVSHAAIDMSLKIFHEQYGFPVILTRFANFYGACQQLYRIVPRAFIYANLGRKLPLHGGGYSRRSFINGHDVATALHSVIRQGVPGDTYHFSTDEIVTIRDLVTRIAASFHMSLDDLCEISEDRPGKDAQYFMSWEKARSRLGWTPQVSLSSGLDQVGSWVNRHIDVIKAMNLNYEHKE